MSSSGRQAVLVLCTAGGVESARTIGRTLVEEGLAACVQLLPIQSIYRWKGRVCEEGEVLLLIKSLAPAYARLEERLQELHDYETPEILRFTAEDGLADYIGWIEESVDS